MLIFTAEWRVLVCPLGTGLRRDLSAKCLEHGGWDSREML